MTSPFPSHVWLQVLVYLDYFDLCKIKRVNKLTNDCCKVRSVQEALFLAPFHEMSIQNRYRAGEKRIEMHPALSKVFYLLENGLSTLENYGKSCHGVFRIEKVTRKPSRWFGFERISTYHDLDEMGDLGFENATNPPLFRFKMLGRIWTTFELRDFRHRINDRSRIADSQAIASQSELDLQSKTTSSTQSESTFDNRSDFNTPNTKAVTVNDILGALSVHFEKVEGQADLDLCWEKWPFSPNSKVKDPEIQRRTYNANPDLYASYIEGSECMVAAFWTEVWDDPRGQIDRTDLPDCEDEDLDGSRRILNLYQNAPVRSVRGPPWARRIKAGRN